MRAITLIGILLVGLLCPLGVVGQVPSAISQCANDQGSLLWHVKGDNSQVYLFGSIHLGKAEFYPLPDPVEDAFRQADYLVFEVDPSVISDPAAAAKMQQQGLLAPDQKLADLISPDLLEELTTTLASMGMPVESMLQFKPWFLASVLTNLQILSMGYSPDYGVEYYLFREMPNSASILELESFDSQLAFLQSLNGEAFLAYTLAELQQGNHKIKEMIDAWLCADQDTLQKLLVEQFDSADALTDDLGQLKQTLLLDRNKPMANKIASYLSEGEGNYFVVVGAAHYLGEGSIIEHLQQQGYRVSPVH